MVSKLQPHRKRKGERPDISPGAGTQIREPGGEWRPDVAPKPEEPITPTTAKPGGEPTPPPAQKGLGAKEVLFGKPKIKGEEVQLGYAPALGGFETTFAAGDIAGRATQVTGTYGKDIGQASRIIIDIIKNHPKAAAWAATVGIAVGATISGKASLMSWTAVDNIGQRASFTSSNAFRMWMNGDISTADVTEALEVELRDVQYAESFVKKEVAYNPASWFGLGKPSQLAAEANTRVIQEYLDTVKGGG